VSLLPPRTYTVEEATAALADVRPLVERIVAAYANLPELQEAARVADYKRSRPSAGPAEQHAYEAAQRVMQHAEMEFAEDALRLERLGVVLKDPGIGLIDFYGYRDGVLVELCWKLGEPAVEHWHRIGDGFPGRQPI